MIKIKCTSTSTRTSSVSDVIIDTSSPDTEIEDSNGASKKLSAAAVEDEPAPVAAAAAATETEAEIEKGEEQLEKEETIAMGKEEEAQDIATPSSDIEKGTSDTAAVSEESETFSAAAVEEEEPAVVPEKSEGEMPKAPAVPTSTITTTITLIYEGEVALSDLPADGSELRSTLTLRLVDPEPSEASDSAEGLRNNLQMGFKAAYETLESLISSKRLELAQLEREIVAIGQRISELRRAAEKKPTASPAKESGNNSSKKSMKGRGSKKVVSTKRSSGSRGGVATAAGSDPELDGDSAVAAAAKGGWLSMQTITTQVTTLATDFAALAVQHRAVALFAISAVGIYLAGDSASV